MNSNLLDIFLIITTNFVVTISTDLMHSDRFFINFFHFIKIRKEKFCPH